MKETTVCDTNLQLSDQHACLEIAIQLTTIIYQGPTLGSLYQALKTIEKKNYTKIPKYCCPNPKFDVIG